MPSVTPSMRYRLSGGWLLRLKAHLFKDRCKDFGRHSAELGLHYLSGLAQLAPDPELCIGFRRRGASQRAQIRFHMAVSALWVRWSLNRRSALGVALRETGPIFGSSRISMLEVCHD